MAEIFIEDLTFVLASAITSTSATSITVSTPTGIGTVPASMSGSTFRIRIDNELMCVTATDSTGLIWTVQRGTELTTAATHAIAATVYCVFTGGAILAHGADTCLSDVLTNLPGSGVTGRLFLPAAGSHIFRDNGTSWQAFGPVFPMIPPPVSGWTPVNFPTSGSYISTYTYTNGYPELASAWTAGGVHGVSALTRAVPGSTPYNCDGSILFTAMAEDGNQFCGLCFYNSGTGAFLNLCISIGTNAPYTTGSINVTYLTSATAYSSTPVGSLATDLGMMRFFRIRNDGTNLTFWTSADGTNYTQFGSLAISSYFTPTHIGFFIDPIYNVNSFARLIHWNIH